MPDVDDQTFARLIEEALASLPGEHVRGIKNIAITWTDDPTADQRRQLALRHDQTLLGLYEGVPLPERQGLTPHLPDKITLFRGPLCRGAADLSQVRENIRHTLWHEIAHYYGLDHKRINELE